MRSARFRSSFWSSHPPQHAKKRPERREHLEESHGRAAVCVQQKCNPRYDHPGFVCRSAWRCDGVDADLCGSNSSLRPGGSRLDACDAGIGAFVMALLIAHLPPMKHAGKALLWCVTGFGVATILFGCRKYSGYRSACFFSSERSTAWAWSSAARLCNWLRRMKCAAACHPWTIFSSAHRTSSARGIGIDRGAIWPVISVLQEGSERSLSCWALDCGGRRRERSARWIESGLSCRRVGDPGSASTMLATIRMRRATKSSRTGRRRPGDSALQPEKSKSRYGW
jgi:hypothetical protein